MFLRLYTENVYLWSRRGGPRQVLQNTCHFSSLYTKGINAFTYFFHLGINAADFLGHAKFHDPNHITD